MTVGLRARPFPAPDASGQHDVAVPLPDRGDRRGGGPEELAQRPGGSAEVESECLRGDGLGSGHGILLVVISPPRVGGDSIIIPRQQQKSRHVATFLTSLSRFTFLFHVFSQGFYVGTLRGPISSGSGNEVVTWLRTHGSDAHSHILRSKPTYKLRTVGTHPHTKRPPLGGPLRPSLSTIQRVSPRPDPSTQTRRPASWRTLPASS